MPDLITHLASAYFVKKGLRLVRSTVIFYLGALLPDIISRPIHILWPRLFPATLALHTPVGIFFVCWLLSLLFRYDQRKRVFGLLFSGSCLHFLLDMLQKHLVGGYLWLFPFSLKFFSFGWIGPEDSLSVLPLTLFLVFIVYALSKRRPEVRAKSLPE